MNLDVRILQALRSATESGVSGAELSQKFGVSRAAVWARIRELRAAGYEIVASPHLGYRLISTPDRLHGDDLLARLGATRVIGRDIRVFEETTSTNDVVEKLARDGAKEGVVVFAESQTRGRGRLGRRWVSPRHKGLWFSMLLRPALRPQEATRITIASATALRRAIQQVTGLPAQIKWPNDILFEGRKLAGILTELRAEPDRVQYIILGIGVDVNFTAADFPPELRQSATSLRMAAGQIVERAELAVSILRELDLQYHRMLTGRFTEVADEFVEHCVTIGQSITAITGSTTLCGRAESLDDEGALLIRTEYGRLAQVTGGEVVTALKGERG